MAQIFAQVPAKISAKLFQIQLGRFTAPLHSTAQKLAYLLRKLTQIPQTYNNFSLNQQLFSIIANFPKSLADLGWNCWPILSALTLLLYFSALTYVFYKTETKHLKTYMRALTYFVFYKTEAKHLKKYMWALTYSFLQNRN